MRVLHVYHDFHPIRGGIEDYLADLTRAQAAQGLECIVLCANDAPLTHSARWHGVRILRAAAFGRYFTPFCPTWPLWIARLKADVVHLHLPCPLGEWSVALARARRLVVSLHNDYVRPRLALRWHRPLHRAILRRAAAIIVSSDDYARTSAVLAGLDAKFAIIPYGIDLARYVPRSAGAVVGTPILFAGRLCYYKGVEVLLAAARDIPERMTVVGDGPWRKRLHAQAARAGVQARVQFTGAVSEAALIAYMQASRLFAFPSTQRSEAFGIGALKAMACGLPVVSSDLPGVRWLNRHAETGLTVPARDACALADALNRLVGDEPLRARLAANAHERAQKFTLASMVHETQRVYEQGD